jgi:hypothetical protein
MNLSLPKQERHQPRRLARIFRVPVLVELHQRQAVALRGVDEFRDVMDEGSGLSW